MEKKIFLFWFTNLSFTDFYPNFKAKILLKCVIFPYKKCMFTSKEILHYKSIFQKKRFLKKLIKKNEKSFFF